MRTCVRAHTHVHIFARYCTGGVRCERASAYLAGLGITKSIHQLHGGIHRLYILPSPPPPLPPQTPFARYCLDDRQDCTAAPSHTSHRVSFLTSPPPLSICWHNKTGLERYLEHFPDGLFRGKLYVFDGRGAVSTNDDVLGTCFYCARKHDEYECVLSPPLLVFTAFEHSLCAHVYIAQWVCIASFTSAHQPT